MGSESSISLNISFFERGKLLTEINIRKFCFRFSKYEKAFFGENTKKIIILEPESSIFLRYKEIVLGLSFFIFSRLVLKSVPGSSILYYLQLVLLVFYLFNYDSSKSIFFHVEYDMQKESITRISFLVQSVCFDIYFLIKT